MTCFSDSPTLARHLAALDPDEVDSVLEQLAGGGFTVSIHGTRVPTMGYMVSVAGHEEKFPHGGITPAVLRSYLDRHSSALRPSERFLGGWVDEGYDYLDVNDWIMDREEAIAEGYARKQIAIFDLSNMESLYMREAKEADLKKAAELGVSRTPPPGVSPRSYVFTSVESGQCDVEGFAAHMGEIRQIRDA